MFIRLIETRHDGEGVCDVEPQQAKKKARRDSLFREGLVLGNWQGTCDHPQRLCVEADCSFVRSFGKVDNPGIANRRYVRVRFCLQPFCEKDPLAARLLFCTG